MSDLTPEASFQTLKDNVVKAIESHFPFEGRKNKLVIDGLHVDDKLSNDDIKGQADAKEKDGTWSVPVRGNLKLINKVTGQVIDSKENAVIARLPKMTSRYGYLINGSEYQVDHLFRLKSGAYTRVQQNGMLETEFNLSKSPTNRGFSIYFEPKNERFSFKYGGANIPLYPILKTVGVSDDELERTWGKKILESNRPKSASAYKAALGKFWRKTSEDDVPESDDKLVRHINSFFDETGIRPDTTAVTLGKPFTKVTGEALKIASDKVLGVSRGTQKPDDRDSLAFKEVASIEDFIPEKILRNRSIKSKIRQGIDHKGLVADIINPDLFNRPINEFFTNGRTGVSERSDQTNPVQMLSAHRKTTLMSRELGGLKGEHNLTTEMRVVNPSHFGFLDPMHTPESSKTGISMHLSASVRKNGRDLEAPVYDLKSGKHTWKSVSDFHTRTAVLPDQVEWKNGKPVPFSADVKVKLPGGDIDIRPFKDADYVMPSAKGLFDFASNLIPFLPTDQGNRVSMADKQMEQAISLKHREQPLVQSKTDKKDPNHTFEDLVGNFVATKSTVDGKVVDIDHDNITIQSGNKKHKVAIYNNFPLNDPKSLIHSNPLVKVGDEVKNGQVVADTNYTDKGTLAIGTNLRVGYIPFKGYNYEDGIVISETASKKLTSEHLHKKHLDLDTTDHVSLQKYKVFAPASSSKLTKEQFDLLGDDGIIKPGSVIKPGQVLVAAVGVNSQSKSNSLLARLGKKAIKPYKDKSLVWDEDHVGVVTKVVKSGGSSVRVYVKTEEQSVIGDKLSGRHGNKGIITSILPDHEMPYTVDKATGEKKPLEVLLNPSGVPTRINVGQMLETAASKIAEKTGKPYIVNNFSGPNHDYRQQVLNDLAKHGISDEEMVYDPSDSKRPLGSVLVGPQYVLKLKHQVEKKLTVRGGGTTISGRPLPYDADKQPTKGGEHGGQGFGQLDMYALLGHDARHNIREMATYKSDMQDSVFWNMIQEGHEPPPPKAPFSYDKFVGLLKGMGLNVLKQGTGIRLLPMTHKEILEQAGNGRNEITKGNLLFRSKDLREEAGGLFDPQATGGKDGTKWSFMRLAEPVPNPIFVGHGTKPGPVPVLLGWKMKDFEEVMAGNVSINGKTSGLAVEEALKKIDVDSAITKIKSEIASKTGSALDRDNKKLRYLMALKSANLKPHEAYILHSVPVIPPQFRPVTENHRGGITMAPVNGLYKSVAIVNEQLKNFDSVTFTDDHKKPLREQLWNAMKALQSVGNYRPSYDTDSSGNRELVGLLDSISSGGGEHGQPKQGFFQAKLIKRRQNLSIRSTIIPEPALGIDEVGLPRGPAMELYKPFVVAQLHRWGFTPLKAQDEIKSNSASATKALEKVIEDRPLILKRDPVLHKFSVMAFKPKLVDGKAIQIHPLVTGGFNADFDGDSMAGTVPMSREAVEEAKKMFPSNNLFSPTSGAVMYTPSQESLLGLHLLSKWGKDTSQKFKSVKDLDASVAANKTTLNDVVSVAGITGKTTLGRILLESRLPRGFHKSKDILHNPAFEMTKKTLGADISSRMAKDHPNEFAKSIDSLKNLGNEYSYKYGFSIGLKDLAPLKDRDKILHEAHGKVSDIRKLKLDPEATERRIVDAYQDATQKIDSAIKAQLSDSGNRLATMVFSGARGKPEQLRQMVAAPMLMQDSTNRTLPNPVTRSYAEGLDIGDYWTAQHGARKGTLQRALGTSEPGAISKDILNSTMSTIIVSDDCKTKNGILMSLVPDEKDLSHKDVHDRFLAHPYKLKDGSVVKEGTLITPEVVSRLRNNKITKVVARSPLKCEHGDGMCAKCFGLNENGKLHQTGTNVGVLAGQALGEPAVQMAMDAFHAGGVSTGRGSASVDRITRLRNLLEMPKTLKHQATVATDSGKITSVSDAEAGGLAVMVNGISHYVPKNLIRDDIKVGVDIKRGERLSEGHINPHDLLSSTKDMHAVQNYLTNEMFDSLYDKEGVRRRNVEVAVRSLTNLTKVVDPGHSDYIHGDIVPRTVVDEFNRNLEKGHKPIEHKPILRGIEQVPSLLTQNWIGKLNYRELHRTIQDAAGFGSRAEIHGTHPIAGIAIGSEFGKPPPNKPKFMY